VSAAPAGVAAAVLLAFGLEWAFREPPADYHPVALFGGVVDRIDDRTYAAPRAAGAAVAAAFPLAAAAAVYGALWLAMALPVPAAVTTGLTALLAGIVLWTTSSLRLLLDVAGRVVEDSDADLEAARAALPALVGRDPGELSPPLVRSAAVESLAENLSDGLVAPLFAFGLLSFVSLPAAAAGATYVKAANTLDSMLGYPGAFGWGSARLDDLVMFVPARLTAVLVGLAAGDPDAPMRARRYAGVPPSPNAGWPIGAVAAALNVRLEKPRVYALNEVADYPTVADGRRAVEAVRRAGVAAYGAVALAGVVRWL
jgi:adenosylcobinamide-phosphate synthase